MEMGTGVFSKTPVPISISQVFHPVFHFFFVPVITWFIKSAVDDLIRKILLFYIMIRIIMGLFISDTMPQFL